MRYIPVFDNGATPDQDWLDAAKELTAQLANEANPVARSMLIKANQAHWLALRDWLMNHSEGKCWYSEARDCVTYWEVEHFRPKGSVKELKGICNKGGYWWLAFAWENYRIAGQVINRKKSSYFPLRTDTFVADAPGKPYGDETPYFLDPTDQNDCELVFFEETGRLVPKPGANVWEAERVQVTCDRFNLNYQTLVDCRKTAWQDCRRLIAQYMNLLKDHCETKSATKRAEAKRVLLQLRELVRYDKPFSTVVISCVIAANEPSITKAVMTSNS